MKSEIDKITQADVAPKSDKDKRCAPSLSFKDGSCIPLNALVKMANAYNKEYPNNKIRLDSTYETLAPNKYKMYLVYNFKKNIKSCDDQQCWLKQSFMKHLNKVVKEELEKDTFRPASPEGKFTWLNTTNIDDVMAQYEVKYPEFKYLSTVPIDFDELPRYGLKNINFQNLLDKGKTKIGVVFNLDEHHQGGSHWVSLFADLDKGTCYFSDSYGVEPEPRIRKFMTRIANFLKQIGKTPVVDYNKMQHQRGSNACGVYSINFIVRQLRGVTFDELTKKRLADSEVNKCREFYFTKTY